MYINFPKKKILKNEQPERTLGSGNSVSKPTIHWACGNPWKLLSSGNFMHDPRKRGRGL